MQWIIFFYSQNFETQNLYLDCFFNKDSDEFKGTKLFMFYSI